MCPHVLRVVGVLYEALPADGAHVGLLARVRAVVRIARRLVTETFFTILACIGLALRMHESMRRQQSVGREPLPADATLEGAKPYVTRHVSR